VPAHQFASNGHLARLCSVGHGCRVRDSELDLLQLGPTPIRLAGAENARRPWRRLSAEPGKTVSFVYIEDSRSNIAFSQSALDELPSSPAVVSPAQRGVDAVRKNPAARRDQG
jgi:hypothetical protein